MNEERLGEGDIGGVHVKYLLHCPRQLWLYSRGIRPEGASDLVAYGNAIDATTYTRRQPVDLGAAKIDWLDADGWVHERKSSQREQPGHREQALLYCLLLSERGVFVEGARLHYPATRRTVSLAFDGEAANWARSVRQRALDTIRQEYPPERIRRDQCGGCAFDAYCWSG
jgi:CRISPR-associated exonuclease Cas4